MARISLLASWPLALASRHRSSIFIRIGGAGGNGAPKRTAEAVIWQRNRIIIFVASASSKRARRPRRRHQRLAPEIVHRHQLEALIVNVLSLNHEENMSHTSKRHAARHKNINAAGGGETQNLARQQQCRGD